MEITRENGDLVLRVPLWQKSYDAIDEYIGNVPNLIGVIAGQDYSISQLCDLGYKGTQQEGFPIIMFPTKEDLEEECKKLGLNIWTIPCCAYCGKPERGVSTWDEKGLKCFDCEHPKCSICHKGYTTELSDMCSTCWKEA